MREGQREKGGRERERERERERDEKRKSLSLVSYNRWDL